MKKERDNRREKLYRAERQALCALETSYPTIKDVTRFICKCCNRATIKTRYGQAVNVDGWAIEIADGRGTRNALAYGTNKISLPAGWARTDRVALHELAHIIHSRLSGNWALSAKGTRTDELKGGAAHGWQFAAIYLDLVTFCMGKEAGAALKAAYRANGVRFKPKRQRNAPVDREAMIARMAKARAARMTKLAA